MGLLNPVECERLIRHQCISTLYPWNTENEGLIDEFYFAVCEGLKRTEDLNAHIEWDHYGSGYASFIDAWFYRETKDFQINPGENHYRGLTVLFSRLSPYYLVSEGEKWRRTTDPIASSSYLPCFNAIDAIGSPAVAALQANIEPKLTAHGLRRVKREMLEAFLPAETVVETILSDPPYRQFDALFHWAD